MSSEFDERDSTDFEIGDVAVDVEKDKRVIVVEQTDISACEYPVFETPGDDPPVCVDYYNSEYPDEDPVVEAVYEESCLWEAGDEFRRAVDAGEIDEEQVYGFPRSRLEK